MTEEPAPRRGRTVLKRAEWVLESVLFNSRWLMAPFYSPMLRNSLVAGSSTDNDPSATPK